MSAAGSDDDDLHSNSVTLRLRSTADLAAARRRIRRLLTDAGIDDETVDVNVLAISELLTNAIEASDEGSAVTAVALIDDDPAHGGRRRIDVDILNTGEPMLGRLKVDSAVEVRHTRPRGRGLAVAGHAGDVVVEGLVGGTRARFRSVIDHVGDGDGRRSA